MMKKSLFIILIVTLSTSFESVAQNQQTDNRSQEDMEALFWARKDSAKMNFIQADVDFMTGMIGHHAQALIMSALAPKNDASEAVKTLAARIINAQKDEIQLMQTWLYDRGLQVPQVHIDGLILTTPMGEKPMLHFYPDGEMEHTKHQEHGMEHNEHTDHDMGDKENHGMNHDMDGGHTEGMMHDHSMMPGMLSQEQLEELAAARGAEFDRLFLRYMIQHHAGAIVMVKDLVNAPGAAQETSIEKLAGDINVDQTTEIERMRLMLEQMIDASATLH